MGTKRKLPFGYKMESGRVVIDSVERSWVLPRTELDANLIAMNISAVLVDSNGKVKIRLKNDQTIERGE